jgi:hypothetical protein
VPEQAILPHLQAAFGLKTSGLKGNKSFSINSVRENLTYNFYIAQLPDGKGGYIPAKHKLSICRRNPPGIQTALAGSCTGQRPKSD